MAKSSPVVLLLPDHSFVSTLLSFPPPLLYLPNIPTKLLPPANLLAALLSISFLVTSAIEFLFCRNLSSKFGVASSHFRHFVYKCITDCSPYPHHQNSADSTTPVRSRKVPIAPCPVFS